MDKYSDLSLEQQRDAALLIADYFIAYEDRAARVRYIDMRLSMAAKRQAAALSTIRVFLCLDALYPGTVADEHWAALNRIMERYPDD